MLTVCGLGVILAVDALALEWRQAPLAALPLLAALSVPVSILRQGLALPVFVVTALLFLRLVASDHLSTFGGWGRTTRRTPGATLSTFWQVSVAAVVVALICTPAGAGQRPAQAPRERRGLGRRRQRRLPAHHGEPVHPAASRPRREDPHAAGVRRHQGGLDVVPAHDGARPVHQQRVEALVAQPAQRQRRPRGLPRRAGSVGGHRRSDRRSGSSRSTRTSRPRGCRCPTRCRSSTIAGSGWRFDSRTLDVAYVNGAAPTPLTYTAQGVHPRPQPDRAAHAAARAAVDP